MRTWGDLYSTWSLYLIERSRDLNYYPVTSLLYNGLDCNLIMWWRLPETFHEITPKFHRRSPDPNDCSSGKLELSDLAHRAYRSVIISSNSYSLPCQFQLALSLSAIKTLLDYILFHRIVISWTNTLTTCTFPPFFFIMNSGYYNKYKKSWSFPDFLKNNWNF